MLQPLRYLIHSSFQEESRSLEFKISGVSGGASWLFGVCSLPTRDDKGPSPQTLHGNEEISATFELHRKESDQDKSKDNDKGW